MLATKLNLGCGLRPRPVSDGWVNLDKFDLPGVDIKFDLDTIGQKLIFTNPPGCVDILPPYTCLPFKDNRFSYIHAEDILEHVNDIVAIVNELWRVLKDGGSLWIRGPDAEYPEQLWADPTHKRGFTRRSMDGWDRTTYDGKHYGFYFHQNKYFFKVSNIQWHNKGYEYTLIKEEK